jgi:hypothetical protein
MFKQFYLRRDEAGDGDGGGAGGDGGDKVFELPAWDDVRKALPDDIRDSEMFNNVTSVEGLAKSYMHAQKSMGKDKIVVPDKHASSEDYRQVMFKLGLSEKLEDYKFNVPEGVEKGDDFVKEFTQASHKAGVLPHQAEEVFKWYRDYTTDVVDGHKAKLTAQLAEDEQSLRAAWGQAYDDNLQRADIALKELIPDDAERKELVDSGIAKNKSILKLLASASKFFDEDTIVGQGGNKFSSLSPDDALAKARDIQGNMEHPYRNPSHPNHAAAQKEVQNLYKIAYPT